MPPRHIDRLIWLLSLHEIAEIDGRQAQRLQCQEVHIKILNNLTALKIIDPTALRRHVQTIEHIDTVTKLQMRGPKRIMVHARQPGILARIFFSAHAQHIFLQLNIFQSRRHKVGLIGNSVWLFANRFLVIAFWEEGHGPFRVIQKFNRIFVICVDILVDREDVFQCPKFDDAA